MNNRKPLIYVVDDNVSICRALALLLKSHGFTVKTFTRAAGFLSYKHPKLASCLILDIRLPDIDGLALQQTMARQGIAIPIIFITGHGDIPMSVKTMKAGAIDFLPKPFTKKKLLDAITQAILKSKAHNKQSFNVNMEAVAALLEATEQIEQQMQASLSFSALDVLAFPNITQEPSIDKLILKDEATQLVNSTLAKFLEVREREGAQLKVLLEERCIKIQGFSVLAAKRMPEVLLLIRTKLKEKIDELQVQPDFDRLEQELVFVAQKLDITEELDRLDTHIIEVLRVLQEKEPVGRRLDFLMQELNREANTLSSKSTDKEMTAIAIELKVLIEQMREQIQNIE